MRTLIAVLTVAFVAWSPGRLSADDAPGKLSEKIQDLQLTDEQASQIAEIRNECRPKVEEAAHDLAAIVREEVEKVRAVLTPEQKEKIQAFRQERKEQRAEGLAEMIAHLEQLDLTDAEMAQVAEIRKEFRPKIVQALEGLKGTLTAEQRDAWHKAVKEGKKRREIFASLNFTDEQKQKLEAVGKEVRGIVREEMEKMRDVLSESQKEQLQEFQAERQDRIRDRLAARIANYRELNLTDAQKAQLADIRKEFRPKVQEAGNKLRAAVRDELDRIVTVLKG